MIPSREELAKWREVVELKLNRTTNDEIFAFIQEMLKLFDITEELQRTLEDTEVDLRETTKKSQNEIKSLREERSFRERQEINDWITARASSEGITIAANFALPEERINIFLTLLTEKYKQQLLDELLKESELALRSLKENPTPYIAQTILEKRVAQNRLAARRKIETQA